eukprot:g3849.t1
MSLAVYNEHVLKTGIGCRGARLEPGDPAPAITLDLGEDVPIDTLYLVPVQAGGGTQGNIFPKRFTIEFSDVADFSVSEVLYTSGDKYYPETGGKPVKFTGQGATARYVRLTVDQGHPRGGSEIFGVSEIVVISDSYPVSFGCNVSTVGALEVGDFWYPEAVVDGRMPLGVWQGGQWARRTDRGELEYVEKRTEEISWSLDLGEVADISLINLFPFDIREVLEAGILPEVLDIQVRNGQDEEFRTIAHWANPIQGVNHETPLVFAFNEVRAREIRVVGRKPREVGGRYLYGLSEIEVWSDHKNLARGKAVILESGGEKERLTTKTNGFASNRQIIPVGSWLSQLHERWRVENEINALQPMRAQMASESELNATWGSAMMLGLTFLIPVFIVERRRLISRNQIDQLRKRIASDLHDDIGSNLGSISMIARTARKDLIRLAGPAIVGEDLNEMESIARESSLAMRDIVWLLERKQDSIGDLVHRMRETASRMLREIDYSIECDSSKATAKLSLDAKRHLFLFYKEAIHNIVKHSKATEISIRLWDKGDKLALAVTDNGGGLPMVIQEGKEVPQRVRKLDERARVLEGQLDIKTERDKAACAVANGGGFKGAPAGYRLVPSKMDKVILAGIVVLGVMRARADSLVDFTFAMLHERRGNAEQAEDLYKKAYVQNPARLPLARIEARRLLGEGKREEAIDVYRKVVALRPKEPLINIEFGDFVGNITRGDTAARDLQEQLYRKVHEMYPGDYLPVERLIRLAREQGEDELARRLLTELELDGPTAILYFVSTTRSLYDSRDEAAAARIDEALLEGVGNFPQAPGLARAASDHFRETGRSERAIDLLRAHVVAAPSSLDLKVRLAILLFSERRDVEGLEILEGVIRIHPHKIAAHEVLEKYYRLNGLPEEARKHSVELLKIRGGSADEFATLAADLMNDGQYRDARILLEKAVFDYRDHAGLHMKLAMAASRDPETKSKAGQFFRRAEELLERGGEMDPQFMLDSAEQLVSQGETEAAEERLKAAIRVLPREAKKETAAALRALAAIWIGEGRNADAARELIRRAESLEK